MVSKQNEGRRGSETSLDLREARVPLQFGGGSLSKDGSNERSAQEPNPRQKSTARGFSEAFYEEGP